MAGLQSCLGNMIINNIAKRGISWQTCRGRHFLAFHKSATKQIRFVKIFKTSDLGINGPYRLSSTSAVLSEKTVTSVTEPLPELSNSIVDSNTVVNEVQNQINVNANSAFDSSSLPPIPSAEDPTPVLTFIDLGLKEPSFKSLGLGSWWPPGILQQSLELLHINFDLSWCAAIALVSVIIRALLFPLVLKSQSVATRVHNNLPEYHKLSVKLTEARQSGNYFEAAMAAHELQAFLKEKKIMGFDNFLLPIVQAPIFISMLMALKGMANAPVESMRTGGLFWFEDLTVSDPYYILPLYMAGSLYLILQFSIDKISTSNTSNQYFINLALKGLPIVIIPFTINMQSAVLFYFSLSNTISLIQVTALKIPQVRTFFKLPEKIEHSPSAVPSEKKGVVGGFKEVMANIKITKEVEERERLNTITFEKAGKAGYQRTFKRDPTQSSRKIL